MSCLWHCIHTKYSLLRSFCDFLGLLHWRLCYIMEASNNKTRRKRSSSSGVLSSSSSGLLLHPHNVRLLLIHIILYQTTLSMVAASGTLNYTKYRQVGSLRLARIQKHLDAINKPPVLTIQVLIPSLICANTNLVLHI